MRKEGAGPFEAVEPTAATTASRFAQVLAETGYEGLVLRNPPDGVGSTDLPAISEAVGLPVVDGLTVRATDRSRAGSEIARHRSDVTVLFGETADDGVRHFLAGQERLDVLRIDATEAGTVGHTTVQRAATNGIAVEVDLGAVLRHRGGSRVRAIGGLRRLIRFIDHADCPFVVTGSPQSHLDIRAPRELVAVGEAIGLADERIRAGLAEWGAIIERTRRARDDRFIEPGVERLGNEADDR